MLDRNINSIIYQSYIKLGDIAYELAKNAEAGDEGTKRQNSLWNRAIWINQLLKTIDRHIEVVDNSVYRVILMTDQEMNQILNCLKQVAKITDFPLAPNSPFEVSKLTTGSPNQGPPGNNGQSSYFALAYATDNVGTGLSSSPMVGVTHFAFKNSNQPIPFIASTFTGLWIEIPNNPGQDGQNGTNGASVFPYIGYAQDENGTDFSTLPSSFRRYIALLFSPVEINPITATHFNGLWGEYKGNDGNDGLPGTDGKTIIVVSGVPSNSVGTNGDVALDTTNWVIYAPKANNVWPSGHSLTGPPGGAGPAGNNGTNGTNGTNAFNYIAWADDPNGNGFTNVFDPNKDWIAFKSINTEIITPVASNFIGLWSKYRGSGDRWSTTSTTSLTIGLGVKSFIVETGLAYVTGQRFVMAQNGVPGNRMEGYVIDYNQTTGQFTGDVTDISGAGTFSVWDVSIQGAPSQIITADSYYAELYIHDNAAGTPQSLTTTPVKISQFGTLGDISGGMSASVATDDITSGVVGEFSLFTNLTISGTVSSGFEIQVYKNGSVINKLKRIVYLNATPDPVTVDIHGLVAILPGDVIELRVNAVTGTPDFLVVEGTFGMFTTGTPAAPEFTKFGGLDFDIGADIVIDAVLTSLGDVVIWEYKIKKGNNIETGIWHMSWDSLGNTSDDGSSILVTLGTVDVTLHVDLSGGNVRLLADITSDDWEISGIRRLL